MGYMSNVCLPHRLSQQGLCMPDCDTFAREATYPPEVSMTVCREQHMCQVDHEEAVFCGRVWLSGRRAYHILRF